MNNYRLSTINIAWLLLFVLVSGSCSPVSDKKVAEPSTNDAITPAMHSVEMSQMKFYPAELKVKKGDKVVFVNHDIVIHDITEESKKAWNSSPMRDGQTWILTATETVNYYCSIHPVMKGKIVVE
jgi:plastocyanin